MSRLHATYRVETPYFLEEVASFIAGEQSTGTFIAVPGETSEVKERFAAKVESIIETGEVSAPSLPSKKVVHKGYRQGEIEISWPVENFGYNLPVLISTIQGNLYELSQLTGIKLLQIQLPANYTDQFRGPAFGIEGTRKVSGVKDRPLIGTIIKPSIGLTPDQTAEMVEDLVEAGIDFIKDDELMANAPHSPLKKRVDAVLKVINNYTQRTGRKVLYAFNISDELDAMLDHYEYIVKQGGLCAMVSLNSVGMSAVKKICDQGKLIIHGHRNGWGALNRHPYLGLEFDAYQTLWRLAGVDQLHVNGIANKFWEHDESVVNSIRSCQQEMGKMQRLMPVVSSGQWGGQAPETYARTQSVDVLYLAGGGIQAHPQGAKAGVMSLQLWWRAAMEGLTMQQAVIKYPQLETSIKTFHRA